MSRRIRWLLYILVALTVLTAGAGVAAYLHLQRSLPATSGRIELNTLESPVTVIRDEHGIPTIRAESLSDAYTALGFVHAQDRLWQMDLMRRAAAGRLAELIGEPVLGIDKFMRVMGFEETVSAQVNALSKETRGALKAYADGVNAFLKRDPVLPLEFQVLRYEPESWKPADSLSWIRLMALQLSGNWREEIEYARVAKNLSEEQREVLYGGAPAEGEPTIETLERAGRSLPLKDLASLLPFDLEPKSASNAWVLGGNHTARGAPILANDPHLALRAPGHWYLARIETPNHTWVGATAPGVPFVILGRNKHVAWGLTTTHSDTQDLFIEKVLPEQPGKYVTPSGPKKFETRTEVIDVAGRDEPVRFEVRATRHGPVLSDTVDGAEKLTRENNRVLALSWPGLSRTDRTLDAIRAVNMAPDVPTALKSFKYVGSPQQNIHLADDAGNIAVAAPGWVPVRPKGNGRVPVPGWSGEYDWQGMIPTDSLPRTVNPPNGRIVNANNKLVPDSYLYMLTHSWPPPYRAARIKDLLESQDDPATMAGSKRIQLDVKSATKEILLPLLIEHGGRTARGRTAVRMLRSWNGEMAVEAPEPLIFVAWVDWLNRAIISDELGSLFGEFERPKPARLRRILQQAPEWCDDVSTEDIEETCGNQVQIALEQALTELAQAYGNDLAEWRWGDAHRATLPHPALSRVPLIGGFFENPIATPGGDETVNRGGAGYSGNGPSERYVHRQGAGLRAIHDMAMPPASSRFMIADGQSGNPLSEHYAGMSGLWSGGRYVKLVGETQETSTILRLTPAAR